MMTNRRSQEMSQWQKIKLVDVSEVIGGGTPNTKNYDFWNGDIPWLTPKDLSGYNFRYISKGERNITGLGLQNSSARMLPKGTVLLTSRAPIGYVAIAENEVCTNQGFKSIVLKEGYYPEFFYYLLKNNIDYIVGMASGSTFAEISGTQVKNLEFTVPPLEVQRKIAGVLGALDDKIELNNKINQNLELQAQALFKSWFVDFEPFDGTMPEDWEKGTFSKLILNSIGGDWGKEEALDNYTEEVYCMRGADIPEVKMGNKGKMPKRYILPKNYLLKKLKPGDLVVEISGGSPTQSTGRIAVISDYLLSRYNEKIICTNFCRALHPREDYSAFVYYYWQYLYNKNTLFSYENGTTGIKNLDISGFLETEPINLPSRSVVSTFSEICEKIFKQIYNNGGENEKLANIRDTLLPKLMSGAIDVDKVEILSS